MTARAALLTVALAAPAGAQEAPPVPAALPSGQNLTGHDTALERQADGQMLLVLRYLAPRIAREGGDLGYDDVAGDLDVLCEAPGRALAAQAAAQGTAPDQIVIALMDRPVPRGTADPNATVFMAAYGVGPEGCEWR